MKKVVLKVELNDDRIKQKAMKAVSGISGVESLSVDMKNSKLTLTGDIDPVNVVSKLRKQKKLCHAEIVSVGPAKEEKKEEPKKVEQKKPQDDKKPDPKIEPYDVYGYNYYYRRPKFYYVISVDEDPNACVIC